MEIRRLSYALGAEIIGVDISRPLNAAAFAEIHAAFLEHSVLLFRGYKLSSDEHVAFARRFGDVDPNEDAVVFKHPVFPEIMQLRNPKGGAANGTASYQGEFWHSDISFRPTPPAATMLRALEVPEVGGDTMFANMYLAYDTLSDGMKALLKDLHAVHVGGGNRIDRSTPEREAETTRQNRTAQPLARVHPESGRTSLYLGNMKTIVGMTAEESAPLLHYLIGHATREQFCYRHQWRLATFSSGTTGARCTEPWATTTEIFERNMERSTIIGTPSGYLYDGPLELDAVGAR